MANVANEILTKSNEPSRDFKNKIQGVGNQLEKMSHEVGDKIEAVADEVAAKSRGYMRSSREYVQENPVKVVAIATAVGVVAGTIATLVMSRNRH